MIDMQTLFSFGEGKKHFDCSTEKYDILLSAFNLSARVRDVFADINAKYKCWLIHNEYCFLEKELPSDGILCKSSATDEGDFIHDVIATIPVPLDPTLRLCVDITGFMRPHLMFLMKYLWDLGFANFDMIYTEPSHYSRRGDTVFSSDVIEVRQVNGYEGTHSVDMTNDVLVVGAGYDHDLVSNVIANKSSARLLQLLSLPSLSADMYQESLVRLNRVADAPFRVSDEYIAFSSANDPFVTFLVLTESIKKFTDLHGAVTNFYLSPLATKPQTVGFALFYLRRLSNFPASIVFPFAKTYSKETGTGVGRTWLYPIAK